MPASVLQLIADLRTYLQVRGRWLWAAHCVAAIRCMGELHVAVAVLFDPNLAPRSSLPPHFLPFHLQEKCEPPVYVSDRRLVKAVALMQVAAYTSGRSQVAEYDCLLLRHILWQR